MKSGTCPNCAALSMALELKDEIAIGAADEIRELRGVMTRLLTPRPLTEWSEEDGEALWWTFPLREAPYVGSPLDTEWPGYHTHWTPIAEPSTPLDSEPAA